MWTVKCDKLVMRPSTIYNTALPSN